MSNFPVIRTAIPLRRYQYGDFSVALLVDIASADRRDYEFIAAFVKEGESQPRLFVVSERLPAGERDRGSHRLRVVTSMIDEIMDVDDRWRRADDFGAQMLQLGCQILGLEQETPYPLG